MNFGLVRSVERTGSLGIDLLLAYFAVWIMTDQSGLPPLYMTLLENRYNVQ